MTFIGDRFVSVGHHWLDIVSGGRVSVRTGAPPPDLQAREAKCRERWSTIGPGPRLVDFGRQGTASWFEAEVAEIDVRPGPMRHLLWPQIADLAEAIRDGRFTGHVSVEAPPGAGFNFFCGQLARRARDAGFVTVRADAPIPFGLRRQLMHRHLVLLAPNDVARGFVSGWLAQLAMISDRRHVLIERVTHDVHATIRLNPFAEADLAEAARADSDLVSPTASRAIQAAASESGGWPAAFVRRWQELAPLPSVARERALSFGAPVEPVPVSGDLARAATYARRGRPNSESQWHGAAVAAASRRGDIGGRVHACELWVERLVDGGRYARAIDVARRALGESPEPEVFVALSVLLARAHLAAAEVTRAETLVAAAIAHERVNGGATSVATTSVRLEVMFWKGHWQEMRAVLAESVDFPERDQWVSLLDWAERGSADSESLNEDTWTAESRARTTAERGMSTAVGIAIRRTRDTAEPSEVAWLEDLVRREGLRGLSRFSQGKSTMRMMRDVTKLIEIVQTAEDELAGLDRICEWVRETTSASACGVVTSLGVMVAGDGLKALGADVVEAARWSERAEPQLDNAEMRATATAPVRFAGATLGIVVATGREGCGSAMSNAVQAASAVAGSLVRSRLDALAAAAHGDRLAGEILGTSPAIVAVRAAVARVALAPFSVVIEGESGTGKELVARALHRHSARRDRTFAALNCAALTDDLVEAELFGHARGAFTHAVNARTGLFEEAHRGTLFLDEVGELSPRAQAKLLRTLQEGEIRRVGENDARQVDVRVIAATNRPLAALAAAGRFRDDLMFRLSVVKIAVPPLRERPTDVPQLALEFWRSAAKRVDTRASLGPDAIALLAELPWPGNVRQLQNTMAALSVAAPKVGRVGARLVRTVLDGLVETVAAEVLPLDEARRQLERRVVSAALAKHIGNRASAARALGLSRQGLSKAIRRLGLSEAGVA